MSSLDAIEKAIADAQLALSLYRSDHNPLLFEVLTSHIAMLEFMKQCWLVAQKKVEL